MIGFEVLAMKAETDNIQIFLLKENVRTDIIKRNIRIPTDGSTRNAQKMESGNHLS